MRTPTSPRSRLRAVLLLALVTVLALPAGAQARPAGVGTEGRAAAVAPVPTTLTLAPSGQNGTVWPVCTFLFSLSATVTAADGTRVSGDVTVLRDGVEVSTESTVTGDAWLGLYGKLGCEEGTETWTARFTDPSGRYAPATSAPLDLELVRRTQTLELTASPRTAWGEPVEVRAELTGDDPGGDVVLSLDGVPIRWGHSSGPSFTTTIEGLEPGTYELTAELRESTSTHGSGPVSTTFVVGPIHGTFHAISPTRLDDTRNPAVDFVCNRPILQCDRPPVPAGNGWTVRVTRDWAGTPSPLIPPKATAVALNVTSSQPSTVGWIAVRSGPYPVAAGQGVPNPLLASTASTGNLWPGHDVATMTVAKISPWGWVTVHNSAQTHLIADAVGYWTNDTTGAYLQALAPTRVLDSRGGAPVGAGDTTVQVVGRAAVPASATAVVVNLTSTQSAGIGYVSARASGAAPTTASALNLVPGVDRSNLAIVPLGADGAIALRSPASSTHMVVDVVGYLSPESGRTTGPLPPQRLLDTRESERTRRAGDLVLKVAGRGGVPEDASAAWLNVTTTMAAEAGHVIVWPGGPAPVASSSNLVPGQDIAALTLVPLAPDGTVTVRRVGAAHVIVDVVGAVDPAA